MTTNDDQVDRLEQSKQCTKARGSVAVRIIATYWLGLTRDGWKCRTCSHEFASGGKPRRTFLRLIDHLVLDHRRLPHPVLMTPFAWTVPVTVTYSTASIIGGSSS